MLTIYLGTNMSKFIDQMSNDFDQSNSDIVVQKVSLMLIKRPPPPIVSLLLWKFLIDIIFACIYISNYSHNRNSTLPTLDTFIG